eukprot:s983_g16.t1
MLCLPDALQLQELFLEVPGLATLDLSDWAVFGELRQLELRGCNLHELALPQGGELRRITLRAMQLPKLYFWLKAAESVDVQVPNISHLHIGGCTGLSSRCLSHLLAGCQRLEQLQLSHCASVESLELSSTRLEEPWANTGTIHTESDELKLRLSRNHRLQTLRLRCPSLACIALPLAPLAGANLRRLSLESARLTCLDLSSLRWQELLELSLRLPHLSVLHPPEAARPLAGSSPDLACKPEPVQILIFSKHLNKLDLTGLRHAKRIDLTLQSWRAQVLWPRHARLQAGSHPAALRLWLPCCETPLPPQGCGLLESAETVDCSGCHVLKPEALKPEMFPNLTSLDMTDCQEFNNTALIDVAGAAKLRRLRCPGLSCVSQNGATNITVKTIGGTPGYKCPVYERTRRCTESSEVYSFGMVMLEVMTGLDPSATDPAAPRGIVFPLAKTVAPNTPGALQRLRRSADTTASWPRDLFEELTPWVDVLCKEHARCRALVHITADGTRETWSNTVTLCCAYSILAKGLSAQDAYQPFAYLDLPAFVDCRGEGANGIELQEEESDFRLSVLDVLMGIQRARDLGWLDYRSFPVEVYTQMLRAEHGDMSWILQGKALAMASPWAQPVDTEGMPVCTPDVLVPYFIDNKIEVVIQCNHPQSEEKGERRELISYDPKPFENAGIKHVWLPFEDGGCPSTELIQQFLQVVEPQSGAFVVHCRSGLGRTATVIGIYAMRHLGFTARSFIGWSRVVRPGTVHGSQQQYLVNLEPYVRPGVERSLANLNQVEQLQMLPLRELSFWALDWGVNHALLANRSRTELIEIILEARGNVKAGPNLRPPDPAAHRATDPAAHRNSVTAGTPETIVPQQSQSASQKTSAEPIIDPLQEALQYLRLLGSLRDGFGADAIIQLVEQIRDSPSTRTVVKAEEAESAAMNEVSAAHAAALAETRRKEAELGEALQLARAARRECVQVKLSIAMQQDALLQASSDAVKESAVLADLQRQLAEAAEVRRQKLEAHRKEQAALQDAKDQWKTLQIQAETESVHSNVSSVGPMEAWQNAKRSLDRLRMRLELALRSVCCPEEEKRPTFVELVRQLKSTVERFPPRSSSERVDMLQAEASIKHSDGSGGSSPRHSPRPPQGHANIEASAERQVAGQQPCQPSSGFRQALMADGANHICWILLFASIEASLRAGMGKEFVAAAHASKTAPCSYVARSASAGGQPSPLPQWWKEMDRSSIAQSTFADLNACQQLADYLLKKLEKDNPHVKLKCLKIIKHVCEQGKPEFKRAVQRKADVVKACLQFRGTPDPLKGDAPNKAVREEADLAVKAVFSSNASLNAYGFSTAQGKKMQGFGSEPSDDVSSRTGAGV